MAHLDGAERFLVGLSPQYWAHTPISIRTLCSLGNVDGIDCLVVKKPPLRQSAEEQVSFLPLSRCDLHGTIIGVDRKANGSCLYLLDDGTGTIDCVHWGNSDMYGLPSLIGGYQTEQSHQIIQTGDRVHLLGKIKCVSVGVVRERLRVELKTWEVRDCVREVHATSITPVLSKDAESLHWLRCCQLLHRLRIGSGRECRIDQSGPLTSILGRTQEETSDPVLNGACVLRLLGSDIIQDAMERRDFPASDDSFGAWRVFGVGCKCELSYKDSLLYCHCQATLEPLDPNFVFRDALLEHLLAIERSTPLPTQKHYESVVNSQLVVAYKTIVQDNALQRLAVDVASASAISVSHRQLFSNTFSALRNDGVVYLTDTNKDTYLLLSRERVLEPYYRVMQNRSGDNFEERTRLHAEQPPYIPIIPYARALYVKKMVADEQK